MFGYERQANRTENCGSTTHTYSVVLRLFNNQITNVIMKITKEKIIEKIKDGATLVQKFDRMYGTYYFIIEVDGTCTYNLNLRSIPSLKKVLRKKLIDKNLIEYTYE